MRPLYDWPGFSEAQARYDDMHPDDQHGKPMPEDDDTEEEDEDEDDSADAG